MKIYSDEGVSAYKERPQFRLCLKQLRTNSKIKGVIVYELSRFGRSTVELIQLINEINDLNKEFVSIKDSIDISTKTGKLMLTLLSAIADYERDLIKERMAAGREYAQNQGVICHRPPKKIDWDKVKKWRKLNMSWTMIAKLLSNDAENPDYSISHQTLIKRAKKEGLLNMD